MLKVVITGATSFIGVHLIKEWLKEECEIVAVVRPNSINIKHIPNDARIRVIEKEMQEYYTLPDVINEADCFYHLAWEGTRSPYRDDKEMQFKNYMFTLDAFESAVKMGCKFFLGSGSQAEYGSANGIVDESYVCNPNTEYGKEKLHACKTLSKKAKLMNMKFIWTRIFSLYGKHDYPKTLIMSAIEKMKNNEPVELTTCTQLWDYLNVEDAARAMKYFALSGCESGIYNVASGNYRPLKEFVEDIKIALNSSSELRFGAVSYGESGPVNLTPDVNKIKNALGWKQEVNFKEGVRKMIIFTEIGGVMH